MLLDPLQLTGRSRSHVFQSDEPRFAIHADVVEPFARMREAAAREGLDIAVFSGFRDFESQADIWNRNIWTRSHARLSASTRPECDCSPSKASATR